MNIPTEELSDPKVFLVVNEEPWKFVTSFADSGRNDPVYTFSRESGLVSFGNGKNGRALPVGSRIKATYKFGVGDAGNMGAETSVTLEWTAESPSKNYMIGVVSLVKANEILLRVCPIFEGSRNFDIATMQIGLLKRRRKLTLGDLVLSVLPWPFHKDLPEYNGKRSAKTFLELFLLVICQRFSICSFLRNKEES